MKILNGKLPNSPFQFLIVGVVEEILKIVFSTSDELFKAVQSELFNPVTDDNGFSTAGALGRLPRF